MMHFGRGVCVCLSVCLHVDLKTIAHICLLLGSYVNWRKISDEFACQDRGNFWRVEGRSLRLSYSAASSEISSPLASFLMYCVLLLLDRFSRRNNRYRICSLAMRWNATTALLMLLLWTYVCHYLVSLKCKTI